LAPHEYKRLLTYAPNSTELADAQSSFHELALDHATYLATANGLPRVNDQSSGRTPLLTRLLAWIRAFWPGRKFSLTTQEGEIVP
jgi:hypothetical protein